MPMRPILRLLPVWSLAVGAGLAAQAPAPPPAAELARKVQAHYDTVKDFTADFTHAYRGGVLRQTLSERGKVRIKKPGRMDWTYSAPEKKQFVSDGARLYSYVAAANSVSIYDMPQGDQASTALLFLTGKGNLTRDFRAAVPAQQPPGAWQLNLVPTTSQAEYSSLSLRVDPKTFALRGLTWLDSQGGTSTIEFSNLKENVGLTDNQFTFKIPKGAEVQQ
jgi:outer membrane lipoprotein carrier protein